MNTIVIETTARPSIDPNKISDCDYNLMFKALQASIKAALADPKLRAEYEAWRKTRKEG